MGNIISGEAKREKEKEREEAMIAEAVADMERLKLGPTAIWTRLVLHHKDVFVSHVMPKLDATDRFFFSKVIKESLDVLKYAGVDVLTLRGAVYECSSISTLEWVWNDIPLGGEKDDIGRMMDQAWFSEQVTGTNRLEFLKWAREVKHCKWDEWTIIEAARKGNLEILKYCFDNGCPYDEEKACRYAAIEGNLDCLRFLFDKVKPSRKAEKEAAGEAACNGCVEILKYFVEERKISNDAVKTACVAGAANYGQLDCLKYLVEEAKVPLNVWQYVANARYKEHPECVNYLLEKGCPEPTDEQYAVFKNRIGVHGTL